MMPARRPSMSGSGNGLSLSESQELEYYRSMQVGPSVDHQRLELERLRRQFAPVFPTQYFQPPQDQIVGVLGLPFRASFVLCFCRCTFLLVSKKCVK